MNEQGNFLMSAERRKELLNKSTKSFLRLPISSVLLIVISFLIFGGGALVVGLIVPGREYLFDFYVSDWSDSLVAIWALRIVGVLLLLFIPLFFYLQLRKTAATAMRLNERHGGLENAVDSLKEYLRSDQPTYSVVKMTAVGEKQKVDNVLDIVGSWVVQNGSLESISDIVAIIGLLNQGTFLIYYDGQYDTTSFGAKTWGDVFALFKAANPNILYTDDSVTLSDGRVADVKTAFKAKDFAAITKQYEKQKGETQA